MTLACECEYGYHRKSCHICDSIETEKEIEALRDKLDRLRYEYDIAIKERDRLRALVSRLRDGATIFNEHGEEISKTEAYRIIREAP